jgi:hypothetical protein
MTTSTQRPNRLISGTVSILEEDDSLAEAVPAEELAAARRHLQAPRVMLEPGFYAPEELFPGERLLGLLIVEGLLIREVLVADRRCGELVGRGSLLRPWDHFGAHTPMPFDVRWRVLAPTRMAVLSHDVTDAAARWPAVMEMLLERSISRAQTLAFTVAIHCLHHVELRVVVLLWHLADRFGRVTPDGVLIPLPLTHRDLATLVGAQRPSVSTALSELARRGTVVRRSDRAWLLCGEPPQELRDLRAGRGRPNGRLG